MEKLYFRKFCADFYFFGFLLLRNFNKHQYLDIFCSISWFAQCFEATYWGFKIGDFFKILFESYGWSLGFVLALDVYFTRLYELVMDSADLGCPAQS